MTRPAIVIGLGGTGQWVLTFLKKELLEVGGGQMPPGVRLLSFDTTSRTTAQTGQTGKRQTEEDIRAGAVKLVDDVEFIPVGDNVMQLASEIAQGKHSHLQWFPAQSFIGKLPPAAFNTKEGSGQIRHMGRLSIFRDLAASNRSQILSRLRAAMMDLQGQVSRDMQMEIIIVGSLAGGTGAGMLVDMALLVRAQARKLVQENYVVRGFFVLPRAFVAGGLGEGRDMLARSFAAWRELDRFMIVSERFGLKQINYHESNQDLRLRLDRRAYDVSYMIDPARNTSNSLENVKAEDGLFPAVAHVVSAILDEKAGKEYTEFISTNLAGKLAQLPRRPFHSVIGSYTLKVPVYFAQEKFSHELALDVLRNFLAPEISDKGRVTRVSELRNREALDGQAGKTAVLRFMASSGFNYNGYEIPNTQFMPLVSNMREKDAQREDAIITQWARGNLTVQNSQYLRAITEISQDDEGKLILRNITEELQFPIWKEVAPSRTVGDTPDAAFSRMKNNVPRVEQEHYGLDTAGGERLRGKYGKALEQAQLAQVARYKKLLQAWTVKTLNGESTDIKTARSGKIGYVRVFYQELIESFAYFVGFLNKVRQKRNEEFQSATKAKAAADRALASYERLRTKGCWLAFWDNFVHPDAYEAQRNYLRAAQRKIDVRKDDILLDVLAETALQMQSIAEKTLVDIDRWIAHLAVGDPAMNIASLYAEAVESLENVNVNHELDKRLGRVSKLIGEHEYKPEEKYIVDALTALQWKVDEQTEGLTLNCGIVLPSGNSNAEPRFKAFRREGEAPARHNLEMLVNLAQRPYRSLHQERPLAKEAMKVYATGQKMGESLDKLAEPMYMGSSMVVGPEVVACYIRVHSNIDDETSRFFFDFQDEMKKRNTDIKGSSLTLVDSEDHHKMTIIRSDDLLPSTDFQMWQQCRDAYIQQVTDPNKKIEASELHVFPAEINACFYEKEMPMNLRKDYRTLHPEVVALLEDREKFEMFFRAYALGFIRRVGDADQSYWAYRLPQDTEDLYLTQQVRSLEARRGDDFFQIIHNFVMEGVDQRAGYGNARRVDWEKLRDAILTEQRNLGKTKVTKSYTREIEDAKGIVSQIRGEVQRQRDQAASNLSEQARRLLAQEFEDLADVAQLVYMKAVESVASLSNK